VTAAGGHASSERWLFVIHVDWRWIRQRPHWLAEEASHTGRALVLFRPHPRGASLPRNTSPVRRLPLLPLPLGRSLTTPRLSRLFAACQRAWTALVIRVFRPTHVYVSHPVLVDVLPADVPRRLTVVYDCMDDAIAMAPAERREAVHAREHVLVSRAQRVIVSSAELAGRLEARYGQAVGDKLRIVLNGSPPARVLPRRATAPEGCDRLVAYAGTVGPWFDFDAVLAALQSAPSVRLLIVGPRQGTEPTHERISYREPVDHVRLPAMLAEADALIMPFKVDAVVTAVNPVKLYEYLHYGVPVIVTRYPEIEGEFGRFVHFYEPASGLAGLFESVQSGTLEAKAERAEVETFLETSSWARRWQAVRRPEGVA
jgi:teichuronic acid biosynthesis glycosyltransferase TuaH